MGLVSPQASQDANDKPIGQSTAIVTVSAGAAITGATSDSATQPGPIANNGTTDDTTPTLTISAVLTDSQQRINVYDSSDPNFTGLAVANGTNWTFTPTTPLIGGLHSFTVEVIKPDGTPVGSRSAAYAMNVLSSNVASITPGEIMRTVSGDFDIVGRDLPTSGLSVTVPGDAKASCKTPTGMTTSGFKVACTFYQLGAQTLEIRTAAKLIGTVSVTVKTNVTGVTWTSPSTTNSGTVKFGETVTYKVAGVNLLADEIMGFAVEKCGVSNTEIEIATRSNTLRTFTCYFNNEAGAVAGQMLGVVKDGLNGQVLFTDWNVPVEVPVATSTISIPATDFVRGVNVALSANGYGTDTLMNAPPYGPADNSAEWDITVPVAGRYELFATYASSENRPLTISFNGVVAFTNALATNTGGFFPANRVTLSQGIVQLTVGANVMKVAETGINVFPHIKGFTLVPVSLINDSFQVNANAPLGTDFTVPSGTTSCTFNSTGKWRLAPFLPEVDANGSGPSAPGLYMDPGVAAALIALRVGSNPGYVHIGVSKTLSVTTGDSLNLKINDYPNSHVDDSGVLTVSWQCQ